MKKVLNGVAACMALPAMLFSQNNVSGKVMDAKTAQPLPGTIIHVQGSYAAAMAGPDGSFLLKNIPGSNCCLIVQYTGYPSDTVCIDLPQKNELSIAVSAGKVLDEVTVNSTRADDNSAMAYTSVSKADLEKNNFGQDLPYLLNTLPSVVTTSDAGTGVGYTGIRIRGSDANRINVTLNGIPVNDAESQGTYWVDLPDVVSSVDNIQVQRGVGTSTNGAGAFGGSLNLQTDAPHSKPYAELMSSAGSFNTFRNTAKAGTGIMENGWAFDARLSRLSSDGFVDRGASDLSSWYLSGGWYGKNISVKAIAFSGKEKTYQSWYGDPEDSVKAKNYTFNPAGMYTDANGGIHYYDNETDNYQQDYYQLHFLARANDNWTFNAALHATKGLGYYEEYRQGELLSDYNLPDTTGTTTDLVRRLWLNNWFYGITYGAHYQSHKKTELIIGGATNNFEGQHYDEIVWAQFLPAGTPPVYRYNSNFAHKLDANVFARINYQATKKLNLFADLQFRAISYHFTGPDVSGNELQQTAKLNFFNPKAGVTFRLNTSHLFYLSISTGHKEPNRDDYVNSTVNSRPKPETLYDGEAGWKFNSSKLELSANLYYMYYINQLVLTGKINDVGAYTRENVAQSYRAGVELEGGWNFSKAFNFSANVAFSQNKILNYSEYIDDYDNGLQQNNVYSSTDIAFSPSVVGAAVLTYKMQKGFSASLTEKYVGKQFLDNSSSDLRKLDPYAVTNLRLSWTFKAKYFKEITPAVQVSNLFNTHYSSNGYTYGYIEGGSYSYYNYYFPQAGTSVMGMLTLKF